MEKSPQSEDKIVWNLVGRVMHEDMHDISDTIPKQTHRYLWTRDVSGFSQTIKQIQLNKISIIGEIWNEKWTNVFQEILEEK